MKCDLLFIISNNEDNILYIIKLQSKQSTETK